MAGSRPDRRVSRTKRRLKEALLEMIESRPFETITVADITDAADVGRSTFYSHYDSKEELLFAGFESWLSSLHATPGAVHDRSADTPLPRFRFSLPLLRHVATQPRFALATVARPVSARIQRRVRSTLVRVVVRELGEGTPDVEARAHAVVGTFQGLLGWWLDGEEQRTPEEVDRVFQAVVAPTGSVRFG